MHLGLFVCLSVHSLFLITLTLGVERECNAFGSVRLSVCPQFISHYPHTRSGARV